MNDEQVNQMLDGIAGINNQLNDLKTGTAERFDAMGKRFDDMEEQFNSLYRYVEGRLNGFETKIDDKADKAQLDRFIALLDKDLKERETDEQERLVLNDQVRRLAARVRVLETKLA